MIKDAGGVCCENQNIEELSEILRNIANHKLKPAINKEYRTLYKSENVAKRYDEIIEKALDAKELDNARTNWPAVKNSAEGAEKILSICVPSYNVEQYLDRCLFSLLSSSVSNLLEIIVVNDGSKDNTIKVAKAYQEHYPNIVKIIYKQNG